MYAKAAAVFQDGCQELQSGGKWARQYQHVHPLAAYAANIITDSIVLVSWGKGLSIEQDARGDGWNHAS